jgi:mannose-6-phosphate isomerase
VALRGEGTLRTEHGDELALQAGTTALVPFAAGATTVTGDLDAIRCLPPDPAAGEGDW